MLASSKAAVLDHKVKVKFGGCQSNKIEGARVLDDHGVTVPTRTLYHQASLYGRETTPYFI